MMSTILFHECQHTSNFEVMPRPGDIVWCRRCADYRTVEKALRVVRVRCQFRGCRYSRPYGDDRDSASRAASRHVMAHPQHHVAVIVDGETVETISQDAGQGMLPFESQVTARLRDNRAHQALLRRPMNPLT